MKTLASPSLCHSLSFRGKLGRIWRKLAFCAGLQLCICALVGAAFSVPYLHSFLKTWPVSWAIWFFFSVMLSITLGSIYFKRILSVLFHAGVLFIIIGAWKTAYYAQEYEYIAYGIPALEENNFAKDLRTFTLDKEIFRVGDFEQENYPQSLMPKQWRTTIHLPNGEAAVASVNHPIRYKNWMIYQMSFGIQNRGPLPIPRFFSAPRGLSYMSYEGMNYPYHFFALDYHEINGPYDYPYYDPYTYAYVHGESSDAGVYYTGLLLRHDPGDLWTFAGYGILIFAALGLALRETIR